MEKRRVALLGAGFIADFHLRALQRVPDAEVAWVCDADRAKAQALAAKAPGAKALGSIEELVAAKPDVVHVLLPPVAHAAAAIACLDGGAHVFVEKPLATSTRDAVAIGEAAARARRLVGVNHNVLFNATFQKLVAAVRARRLGALEHVSFTWNVPLRQMDARAKAHWMFRAPENILLEQGVHPLSAVQFLLGDLKRASVLASGTRELANGALFHRTWQVALELERGTAQLHLAFGGEFNDVSLRAIGQDGVASCDFRRNAFTLRGNLWQEPPLDDLVAGLQDGAGRAAQAAGNCFRTLAGIVRLRAPFDPFGDSIRGSIAAFHAAIAAGREPSPGLGAGGSVIRMCEAVGAAAGGVGPSLREETR